MHNNNDKQLAVDEAITDTPGDIRLNTNTACNMQRIQEPIFNDLLSVQEVNAYCSKLFRFKKIHVRKFK